MPNYRPGRVGRVNYLRPGEAGSAYAHGCPAENSIRLYLPVSHPLIASCTDLVPVSKTGFNDLQVAYFSLLINKCSEFGHELNCISVYGIAQWLFVRIG